jgi:6-phosphogluconate dehydrogenase
MGESGYNKVMQLGFIGLGKMGSRMANKLLFAGHDLVVWNRSEAPINRLKFEIRNSKSETNSNDQKLKIAKTIKELMESLDKPRVVWVMVTAGSAVQTTLDELEKFVQRGDIIIDGGNSHFKDTQRIFKEFKNNGIRYLGIGVSGGIIAAKEGYPLMVGGDRSAYEFVKPILDSLSIPNGGYDYFGEGGAGHFVKMIHNGIEYGIMQSLGEGFGVLDKSPYKLDLRKVAELWQKGTLVSGFMLDRATEVLSNPSILSSIDGYIETSGEAGWAVEQAKKENVPIEIIERSLEFRKRSKNDSALQNSFAAKMIAGLRNAFGGHDVKKK